MTRARAPTLLGGLIDPVSTVERLRRHGLEAWAEDLPRQLQQVLVERPHGDLGRWVQAVHELPVVNGAQLVCDRDAVGVRCPEPLDDATRARLRDGLWRLRPWRKGPFDLLGVRIDAEWRSDRKWRRLRPHVTGLRDRTVLDVGCGNGYYGWRMLCDRPALVVGIDPTPLFLLQYLAVRRLLDRPVALELLPIGVERLPPRLHAFDTLLSMGVLYHRRSPIDHLLELRGALRPGGELVLETLVIEGGAGEVLVPTGRYAKMRNVWFIPSAIELERWLQRLGFRRIRLVDRSRTSTEEQRSTDWMPFESLPDFLDPADPTRTVEGCPAPLRALFIAEAP